MLGGTLWLLLWVHFLLTHGPTTSDYEQTFLGLSYYDSTKLVVLAVALCIVGLVDLRVRNISVVRTLVGTLGYYVALAGLLGIIAGVVVGLWLIPWGETSVVLTTLMEHGIIAAGLATFPTLLGLALFGISVVQGRVVPTWTIAPLIIAALAAIPYLNHTIYGVLIGLGWLAVGYAQWRSVPGSGIRSQGTLGTTSTGS